MIRRDTCVKKLERLNRELAEVRQTLVDLAVTEGRQFVGESLDSLHQATSKIDDACHNLRVATREHKRNVGKRLPYEAVAPETALCKVTQGVHESAGEVFRQGSVVVFACRRCEQLYAQAVTC